MAVLYKIKNNFLFTNFMAEVLKHHSTHEWMCNGKNGEDCGNYTALLKNIS